MKLQDYLQMNARFTRMEKSVDLWAIDYALEKLTPLVDGGKLDQILEENKNQKGEK